ncbi:uncharacterized protein LOC111700357 [Eurytemora carolleeae]|uniref:uncharacterized protein LOC111700357 n=1 Tax=Eurytemora carolleeae TaxID=1294199 RepID=UPI000C780D4F|nr:uncharacterized protein LOC111700357 [Eurytemora carolleeae]|eukprot:XP_023327009.1 uncharacterized protein LOC111700357 [Eurytemora affinis]
MYWVVNRLVYEFTGSWDHLSDCVVGLSGPLFAFKILVLLHSSRLDSTVVYELVELLVLLEKNTMLYHISGILVGGLIYLWWTNENISWRTGLFNYLVNRTVSVI